MKISVLREKLTKKRLSELPHIQYGDAVLDLRIEKYPIDTNEKKRIMQAYEDEGVYAFAEKYNKWLHITKHDISAKRTPSETDIKLPNDWQNYATWVIS